MPNGNETIFRLMIIEARDTINDNLIGEGVVLLRDHIRSDQIKPIQVVRCTHDRDQKPKVSCIKSKPKLKIEWKVREGVIDR